VGAVLCNTHGRQLGGPLCCEHILDASYGRAPVGGAAIDPHTVIVVQVDVVEDGSLIAGVGLCSECARRFGRAPGDVIMGVESVAKRERPDEEGKQLPWVCPVCPKCLQRWTGRTIRE
jgi:hypothetical protein